MNAVSFFLRRTRSSQKDAARLQKLLSCLSVCGGRQRENFFGGVCFLGVFCFGKKSPCWTRPRQKRRSVFFYSSSRDVGVNKKLILIIIIHHHPHIFIFFLLRGREKKEKERESERVCARACVSTRSCGIERGDR